MEIAETNQYFNHQPDSGLDVVVFLSIVMLYSIHMERCT